MNAQIFWALFRLGIATVAIAGCLAGCHEQEWESPLEGPASGDTVAGGSAAKSLTLMATPRTTYSSGATGSEPTFTLVATVKNGIGQPMPDGTQVIWQANAGDFADDSVTTTLDGTTSVSLVLPTEYDGCATVTALAGEAWASTRVCVIQVTPTPESARGLILQADDTQISATGSTTLTATVHTNGSPDEGIPVSFELDDYLYASLSASGDVTDHFGRASVTLIGRNTSGSDQVVEITATTEDDDEKEWVVAVVIKP